MPASKCRVCGNDSSFHFAHTVLGKHLCSYFYCETCGLLQSEEPYWLDEAYSTAIASTDTGLLSRNLFFSTMVAPLFFFLHRGSGKYLDVAGGYGVFTRLMRDMGFDCYWFDLYCENMVARGFEKDRTQPPFTAVTAFEVLEHVTNPMEFITDSLAKAGSRTIVFTTGLFESAPPDPDSWWYYAFESGQHISFYQRRTLQFIANHLGLRFYSSGTIHMMTDTVIHPALYRLFTSWRVGRLLVPWIKRALGSKTLTDCDLIRAQVHSAADAPPSSRG